MQPVLNVAISAARQAGEVILRYYEKLDKIQIKQKAHNDFFSEVDVLAEQTIIQTLSKAFPDHGFIAEESGIHQMDAECVWLIDPLDGTSNYIHGYPYFCVSIALKVKDRIESAVVFDPIHQECFLASRGHGARLNDRRLRVSVKSTDLTQSLIGTTFSFNQPAEKTPFDAAFKEISMHASGIRKTGAAALELAYVAAGRLDGFIGVSLRPWDIAAGALIIQEAGGLVSDFHGHENYLKCGHVMAANPKLFKNLSQVFHRHANME